MAAASPAVLAQSQRGHNAALARRHDAGRGPADPAPLADRSAAGPRPRIPTTLRRALSLEHAAPRPDGSTAAAGVRASGPSGRSDVKVEGRSYRSIWMADDGASVDVIDQTRLPHELKVARLRTLEDAARAIETMVVRGAPLIGATAACGLWLGLRADPSDAALDAGVRRLRATRPTAANLQWALDGLRRAAALAPPPQRAAEARRQALAICEGDVAANRAIAGHGAELLQALGRRRDAAGPLNVLTHCNAGWLATVDWGTALAPVYLAFDQGLPLHVWASETRPRLQGAGLTAWELAQHGVPHTVVVDGATGHLMRRKLVDVCITGTDRTTAAGDVCNKIGTYMHALAARDNGVPFYAAVPGSSIDWSAEAGAIPIEERAAREVTHVRGRDGAGAVTEVAIAPAGSGAANFAFDVTPARLVSGLITERGICPASRAGLASLYPERDHG
jgi:methylthioribose-1-phosphate isomerase